MTTPKYEVLAGEIEGGVVRHVTGWPRPGDTLAFVDSEGHRIEGTVVAVQPDFALTVLWERMFNGNYWGPIALRRND